MTSVQPTVRPFVCNINDKNCKFLVKIGVPKPYWHADNRTRNSTPSSKPDGSFALFLNNQPDALIIQILFCRKTLHVSGNLFAHHQEFSTVLSALVSFMQVFDDSFGQPLYPSTGVLYCTFGTGKLHAGFWWPFPSTVRMFHPDSAWKRSSKTCMKLTSA